VDPGAFAPPSPITFGAAMEALLNNEQQKEDITEKGGAAASVVFEDVEISLSPFALLNLWAMALLVLCVNAVLIIRCIAKRREHEVDALERDYAASDHNMVDTDVDF